MQQHTAPVAVPRPRRPADGDLAALLTADGRAHPSAAVRRHNLAVDAGREPFTRHYFPVLAAFRLGAQRARTAMTDEQAPTGETFERRFGRLVKQAREQAGITQSRAERDAGLTPTTVTRLERGEVDLPVSELADLARVLGVEPGSLIPPAGDQPG